MECFLDFVMNCFGGCFGIRNRHGNQSRWSPKVSTKAKPLEPLKKKKIARNLGRSGHALAETNVFEDVVLDCEAVDNPDRIHVQCDSHLDDTIKQELFDRVTVPLQRPELFSHGGNLLGGPPKGVLLHGPPPSNTGKDTMLAAAKFVAKESGSVFIRARKIANVIIGSQFSNTDATGKSQLVAAMFSLARKLQPAVIFVDDMDSFLAQLSHANMETEFMALWDEFSNKYERARVVILAATSRCNRPSSSSTELDKATQRLLPQVMEIRTPTRKERVELLKMFLKSERVEDNIDYDNIAALTEGYTNSKLYQLCMKAAFIPIRDRLLYEKKTGILNSSPPRRISQLDLENVVHLRLEVYMKKLLQQVTAVLDQTRNESHHHQLQRLMKAFKYRDKEDTNAMEKEKALNDVHRGCAAAL